MIRFDIITNQSVEIDLLEILDEAVPGIFYTLLPGVRGRGRQGVRRGDPIWPEKNALIILFLENNEEAKAITRAVRVLKGQFPAEGIKMFASRVEPVTGL
jgi:hypothetical protein